METYQPFCRHVCVTWPGLANHTVPVSRHQRYEMSLYGSESVQVDNSPDKPAIMADKGRNDGTPAQTR